MDSMKTLSMEINRLQKLGYVSEIIPGELKNLQPYDWKIDEICRFEGMSNPSDNSVLYAISSVDGKRKSLIVDSFGSDSGDAFAAFIAQVPESADIRHS